MRIALIIAAVVVAVAFSRLEIIRVSENSMATAYCEGDYLLAMKPLSRMDLRGHAVVIQHPTYGTILKRVIGRGSDVIRLSGGMATLNQHVLPEPYVQCRERLREADRWWTRGGLPTSISTGIPAGALYVLGDNRSASVDSRQFGVVKSSQVRDIVLIRLPQISARDCKCL